MIFLLCFIISESYLSIRKEGIKKLVQHDERTKYEIDDSKNEYAA